MTYIVVFTIIVSVSYQIAQVFYINFLHNTISVQALIMIGIPALFLLGKLQQELQTQKREIKERVDTFKEEKILLQAYTFVQFNCIFAGTIIILSVLPIFRILLLISGGIIIFSLIYLYYKVSVYESNTRN